jgi:ABC-type multidrug transport system ATPase subunit
LILELKNVGKRFNRNWIFRHLNYTFKSGTAYAITGANGSGKSTLLQVLAGATTLSEGNILMAKDENTTSSIPPENHYRNLSIAAPYLELIEEMTLTEFLQFHFQFKPILTDYNVSTIIQFIQLKNAANRQIRHYSSGMKQRVKLAQAIFSNVPVVLLDEPLTNLDVHGIELYYQLIENFCTNRMVIICSNSESEMHFCTERLVIENFTS